MNFRLIHVIFIDEFSTGVGNIRPAGQLRPTKQKCLARDVFLAKNVYAEEASLRFFLINF